MRTTPLTEVHQSLGAKMHEFAGFLMPIEYSGIMDEHLTVRNAVGVFDVSHMGEIWVKGKKALDFLQRVTSNDVSLLSPGKAQYTYLPNNQGGIVDDIIVYMFDENSYLLVVNASNTSKDWEWLNLNNSEGAELEDASDSIAQLAVQGPKAMQVLQRLTAVDLTSIPSYHFVVGEFAGVKDVIISHTGYTGAGGFELYCKTAYAKTIWNKLFEVGKPEGIKPIGLGARDTLRLESGFCLYGQEIDDTTSPLEAGLGWITKFAEGKSFISRELLEQQKAKGITKKLVRFELNSFGIPRQAYVITDEHGNEIGKVTSGCILPVSKKGIGMGYVLKEHANKLAKIYISIRGKLVEATIQ